MRYIIILFICFISSLWIVNYQDNGDVLKASDNSIYVFKEYTENDENVSNPEMDDLELKSNIVIIFYSVLFSLFFINKLKYSNRYVVYNN